MSTYQSLITRAEQSLKKQCPEAYIQGTINIREQFGRVSVKKDNIYCGKQRIPKFVIYNHDMTGVLVVTEEHRCTCTDDMSHCILRNL